MCGRLNLYRHGLTDDQVLAVLAYAKGIHPRPTPMQQVPVVRGVDDCTVALWGWPSPHGGILTHARSETAATLPTWRHAWKKGRGVVSVAGWWEGSWEVVSPGAHLAVLWTGHDEGMRLAILTQPPPSGKEYIERFPVPLTQTGAFEWLSGGGLGQQVSDLRVSGSDGQQTIFSL